MPPNKKSSNKKRAKSSGSSKQPAIIDGLAMQEMTRDQLEQHIIHLKEEMGRERQERNFFQLERDKINTFWEITKHKLEDKSADLRHRERELEEAEERHQLEIKVYKQKVKHLLFEQENKVAELKAETIMALKVAEDDSTEQEKHLHRGMRELKVNLKEQQYFNEDLVRTIKKSYEKNLFQLRQEFEKELQDIEKVHSKKMSDLREELELQRRNEVHNVEERKNSQINTLMRTHEKSFAEIKDYYNDITHNNMALITNLKEQLEEYKKKSERLESRANEVMAENRTLAEPLNKAKEENADLKRQLENYQKDKNILKYNKSALKTREKEKKQLEWQYEILSQRFKHMEAERDELYNKFVIAIHEVQQKCGLKNILLERRLTALTETLEKKDAEMSEVLTASNLDPQALAAVSRKLSDILDSKNGAIKDLQYELTRVCKAHGDLLNACQEKMKQFGIPVEELGFKPLQSTLCIQKPSPGPAGLVSVPP